MTAKKRKLREYEEALKQLKPLPDVLSMGALVYDVVWSQRRHGTWTGSELIHVLDGTLSVNYGDSRVTASQGDTLVVPKGMSHVDEFEADSEMRVYMVYFTWRGLKTFLSYVDPLAMPVTCAHLKEELARQFVQLRMGGGTGSEFDRYVACSRVHTIFLTMFAGVATAALHSGRNKDDYGARRRGNIVAKTRKIIENRYPEQLSLETIAEEVGVSPYHLSHVFSQESGMSLFEYLADLRMRKSMSLLRAGTHNVAEAAYAVGYNDSKYFSRSFTRRFGIHPRDVRVDPPGNKPPPTIKFEG